MVTTIKNTVRGPTECPKCGSADLVIATVEMKARPQFIANGRGVVEFVGYDCQACGEALRFKSAPPKVER